MRALDNESCVCAYLQEAANTICRQHRNDEDCWLNSVIKATRRVRAAHTIVFTNLAPSHTLSACQVYDGFEYTLELELIDTQELHIYDAVVFKDMAEQLTVKSYNYRSSEPRPFTSMRPRVQPNPNPTPHPDDPASKKNKKPHPPKKQRKIDL